MTSSEKDAAVKFMVGWAADPWPHLHRNDLDMLVRGIQALITEPKRTPGTVEVCIECGMSALLGKCNAREPDKCLVHATIKRAAGAETS